jgi:hypothetical protein
MGIIQELVGHGKFEKVAFVTTKWDSETDPEKLANLYDRHEQYTSNYWKDMIDKGSIAMRHDGSRRSAEIVVKQLLLNREMRQVPKIRRQHSSSLPKTSSAPKFNPKQEKDKAPPRTTSSKWITRISGLATLKNGTQHSSLVLTLHLTSALI